MKKKKSNRIFKNKTSNYSLSGEELHYYLKLYYLIINLQKENQKLKEHLERYEIIIFNLKEAIEYIKSNANIYLNIYGDKIGFLKENDGKALIELLDILDIDKGGENEK